MNKAGSTSNPDDNGRMSIEEIELLEGWLDGDEALTTKHAKRLLAQGIQTGVLGRSFHHVQLGIQAQMVGPRAWQKMGFKVLK